MADSRFGKPDWHDALPNARMPQGGMGPGNTPTISSGTRLARWYARYAGLVFILMASIILAPVAHRMPHLFHADERDK